MNGLDIGTNYRFGFNTQEKEPEINPAVYSAEYWMYDGRIIRRWNVDPKVHPSYSSYSTFANNPIYYIDPLGDTTHVYNKKGIYGFTINDDRPNGQYFIGKVSKEIKEKILSDGDANMRADLVRKHSSFFIGANTVHDMQGIMKISNGEGLERPFVFYFEGGCNELRLMDLSDHYVVNARDPNFVEYKSSLYPFIDDLPNVEGRTYVGMGHTHPDIALEKFGSTNLLELYKPTDKGKGGREDVDFKEMLFGKGDFKTSTPLLVLTSSGYTLYTATLETPEHMKSIIPFERYNPNKGQVYNYKRRFLMNESEILD
jgi:hypothetical protein